jgi:hypothetical protein
MKRSIVAIFALLFATTSADAHLVNGGDAFFEGDAKPGNLNRVVLALKGNEQTVISVTGNGRGDIDCYLYRGDFKTHDADVVNVASDTSKRDGCRLNVSPTKTGTYLLLVQNTTNSIEHYTVNVH